MIDDDHQRGTRLAVDLEPHERHRNPRSRHHGPTDTSTPTGKVLTVVVPSYNSEPWLARCLDSLVTGGTEIEVLVIDDGSTDRTREIGLSYAHRYPTIVRVISQANGGHGEAINTGLRNATGAYFKVVDSDDQLNVRALAAVLTHLRRFVATGRGADLVITNFVYDHEDGTKSTRMRYTRGLPSGRLIAWDQVGRLKTTQQLLMHALMYRTAVLRESGLQLPRHTFYVDNLYALVPLRHVQTLFYLDVDLYRYRIGRPDQSVNEKVMISRIDQQLRVNRLMVEHLSVVWGDSKLPRPLRRCSAHYTDMVCTVTSVMLLRAGTHEALHLRRRFWKQVRRDYPRLYRRLRWSTKGQLSNLPGRTGRRVSLLGYRVAHRVFGFN